MKILIDENELNTIKSTIMAFRRYANESRTPLTVKLWMEQEIEDCQKIVDKYEKVLEKIKDCQEIE